MKKLFLAVMIFFAASSAIWADNLMRVNVAVTNVRSTTTDHNNLYENDPLQETQLEMNDVVLVSEIVDGWARVECPDQVEYTHNNRWQGYPGWVKLIDLSTDVASANILTAPGADDDHLRERIIHKAYLHMGNPYLWGGRSLHNLKSTATVTGVDCSGLINWSYKAAGLAIPRDSHEQYLKARRINPLTIKPADLIFLAKADNPQKVVHVMLYGGEGEIIEAPQTGEVVHRIPFKEKFGKNISQINNGEQLGDRIIYFGTFFGAAK